MTSCEVDETKSFNNQPIIERIKHRLSDAATHIRIADVRIGLGYTAVRLESGELGVAFTFARDVGVGCSAFHGHAALAGSAADRLLELLGSDRRPAAAVGLATANALALTQINGEAVDRGDVLLSLDLTARDRVGMIGYFGPLVPKIRDMGCELMIFEESSNHREAALPAEAAQQFLPDCSVVLITATTLVNNTFQQIISATKSCRQVAVLGASTPLAPEAFSGTPVTLLSGIIPQNPERILQIVSEGGGTPQFHPFVDKVNVRVRLT